MLPMSPTEYVEKHPVTQELLRLGVTKDQLDALRFSSTNEGWAFDFWSVRASPDTPMAAVPLFKAYRTLKWLILENPPYSRDKEDARRYLNDLRAAVDVELGQKHRAEQSERAKKPRVKLGDEGLTMSEIIAQLALQSDHEMGPKKLWQRFFARLEELGLNPEDLAAKDVNAYQYYGPRQERRQISFSHFKQVVISSRKKAAN